MFRRRETMIALRARHQSLEVARGIAYPPLKVPLPPAPVIHPINDLDDPAPPRGWAPQWIDPPPGYEVVHHPGRPPSTLSCALMHDIVLSILAIVVGFSVILLCKYG